MFPNKPKHLPSEGDAKKSDFQTKYIGHFVTKVNLYLMVNLHRYWHNGFSLDRQMFCYILCIVF